MAPAGSAGDPLGGPSLSTFMASSLPKAADSKLSSPYEAVALAAHAGMIAVGFRLIGLGEDDRIDAAADAQNPQPLPTAWNAHNSYAFRYAHSQSALEYIIKVNRLGGKAVVFGLAIGDDKTASFDVAVKDFISEGSLPVSSSEDTSIDDLAKKLQDIFISEGRLSDFGALLKLSIIQKLAPGLSKEGYEDSSTQNDRDAGRVRRPPDDPEPARPYPFNDPRRPNPPLPEPMPGFENEFEINHPPRNPFPSGIIGGDYDLHPGLTPNVPHERDRGVVLPDPYDPLRPHRGGGGGISPFGGQGGVGNYDHRFPPGSRYDPPFPGEEPPEANLGGPRFPGGGRGGFGGPPTGGPGGRPPNPFGGFGDGDFI